jgi:hypothetical protein
LCISRSPLDQNFHCLIGAVSELSAWRGALSANIRPRSSVYSLEMVPLFSEDSKSVRLT